MKSSLYTETHVSDDELLRAYCGGDQQAFSLLLERYRDMVNGVCARKMARDLSQIEDATQTVFVILSRKANTLLGRRSIAGWLHRAAGFVAMRMQRRETRRHEVQTTDGIDWGVESDADRRPSSGVDLNEDLEVAVDGLPESEKEVIVRHYFVGESYLDIARLLGVREESARRMAGRARDRLLAKLRKTGAVTSLMALDGLLAGVCPHSITPIATSCLSERLITGWSESACSRADAVIAEMDRVAVKAMWWKMGAVAAGLAMIGAGTALVVSQLHPAHTVPGAATAWRIESVMGSPSVRRDETMQTLKAGDVLCTGDRIVTAPNHEVQVVSDDGDRILVREEGEVRFEHPTLNTEHRVSKLGEGDPQVRVVCGAIVAELKRPMYFATPHAAIQTDSGSFFLMVASGLTTNGVPWSFSRLDVTGGQVRFRSSETQVPSFEFQVSPSQFAAAGKDCEGKVIETVARKSNSRELSPKWGGVFFLDCAKLYETGTCVLDRMQLKEGTTVLLTADDMLRSVRKSVGMDVKADGMTEDGRDVRVLKVVSNRRDKYGQVVLDLPVPVCSARAIEFRSQFAATPGAVVSSSSFCNVYEEVQITESLRASRHFQGPVPPKEAKWDHYRIERVVVGVMPSGELVHEECFIHDGRTVGLAWIKGGCEEWSVLSKNRSFTVTDFAVNELVEAPKQN